MTQEASTTTAFGARIFRRAGGSRGEMRRVPIVWAFPGLGFVIAMLFLPIAAGAWYAFTNWDGVSASAKWIGVANFRDILTNTATRGALWHTLEIAVAFLVATNVIGLALALALNRTLRSRNVLRAMFFAPVVLSPLATAFVWRYVLDVNGPLNSLLGAVGLSSWERVWLGDPVWALWMIVIVLVWQHAGLAMAFYLAGLQGIPEELDEAAAVDGASTWLRLRAVTLPLLAPAMTISITISTIQGLRVFDTVLALTNGGPGAATETLATELYTGFASNRYGYSAAFALILTVLIVGAAVAQITMLRAREARL